MTDVHSVIKGFAHTSDYGVLLGAYIGAEGETRPDLLSLPTKKIRLGLTENSTFIDWIEVLRPILRSEIEKHDQFQERVDSLKSIIVSLNVSLDYKSISFQRNPRGPWELKHHQAQLAYVVFSLFCFNAIEILDDLHSLGDSNGERPDREALNCLNKLLKEQFVHAGFPEAHTMDAIKHIRNQAMHGHSFIGAKDTGNWVLFYRVGKHMFNHGFTRGYNALRKCVFIIAAVLF